MARLQGVNLVRLGRRVAHPVQLLAVDRVLHDDPVGLLGSLPAHQDGLLGHGQGLHGGHGAWNVLLGGFRLKLALDAVSARREGQDLHGVVGVLLQARQDGFLVGGNLGVACGGVIPLINVENYIIFM